MDIWDTLQKFERLLLQRIKDLDTASVKRDNELAREVGRISQQQSVAVQKEALSLLKELLAHSSSRATAYTNVIVIAGYVAFFTMWAAEGARARCPGQPGGGPDRALRRVDARRVAGRKVVRPTGVCMGGAVRHRPGPSGPGCFALGQRRGGRP